MKLDGEGVEREGKRYECKNVGSRCGVVSFIPPSPTQHISQHHNTLLKKVLFKSILSAMPDLNTCDKN